MKRIFLEAPLFIKVFGSAFTCLACLATGAFYYVGNKIQTAYKTELLNTHKAKEFVEAQQRQLSKLKKQIIP